MKRYAALALVTVVFAIAPCHAQMLQKLEQGLLGGQGQGAPGMMPGGAAMMPGMQGMMGGGMGQQAMIGNVNLPPGQYMMTNVQTGQAFYVAVQNGQMYLSQGGPQMMPPGQGMMPGPAMMPPQQGGLLNGGLGNFLRKELAPQAMPGQ
jgi:hypothetical protein